MLLTFIFYRAAFYVQYAGRRFGVNLKNAWHAVLNRLCIFGVGNGFDIECNDNAPYLPMVY